MGKKYNPDREGGPNRSRLFWGLILFAGASMCVLAYKTTPTPNSNQGAISQQASNESALASGIGTENDHPMPQPGSGDSAPTAEDWELLVAGGAATVIAFRVGRIGDRRNSSGIIDTDRTGQTD